MKTLLIILLLPVVASAQVVDPVISKDYLDRIKDSSRGKMFLLDTNNSVKNGLLTLSKSYNGYNIKKIVVRHGHLKIQPAVHRMLFLSGSFNSTVEMKTINRLPTLQDQYVQGRSLNGDLVWNGPETNELFSYGPAVNTLEFDGSNYVYDVNGKLVYQQFLLANGFIQKLNIDLHDRSLTSGLYLLEASTNERKQVYKLIKQ